MELAKPNIEINWHRTKLPPELLAELNRRSDLKGWIQAGGFLLTMLVTGGMSLYFWKTANWWPFGIALFLHGTVTSFCINGVHELVHGTVFRTKRLNRAFANVFGFIGVVNPHMFWYSHTEHHKYTLHPPDDLEVVVPVHHSIGKYVLTSFINVFFFREFLVLIRFCFGKFTGDWETVIVPETADERRRKVIHWSRWAIGLHLVIIVASVLSGWWMIPILITFSSAYGLWLFYLCNFTQHAGLTENIDDFRLNCRTIRINPISRFLYWHMNWHIEHHMYAAVPCYHLKRLHEAIRHEL
ncbi:MAG: fatty acid desaturase, partial [Verrucomicrobiota bacterium]